jgi:hypothetical protein
MKLTMSEFDKKTFGEHVTLDPQAVHEKLSAFALWNRLDLAAQLYGKLQELERLDLWPQSGPVPAERQIGTTDAVPGRLVVPRKPLANPKHLVIHRWSVVAFLLAEPGNAFTGVAMVGHVTKSTSTHSTETHITTRTRLQGRPKIFLMPVGQGTITTRETSKAYVPKPHESPQTQIYQVKVHGEIRHKASAIQEISSREAKVVHDKEQASHTQITDIVRMKQKYRKLTQENGDFVGFTISKGSYQEPWKNRYAMTSLSSNPAAFGSPEEKESNRLYPSLDWRDEIMRACDNLLQLEADIHSLGWDIVDACEEISKFKALENDFWKSIKNTYWPCYNIAVSTTEALDSEWEAD